MLVRNSLATGLLASDPPTRKEILLVGAILVLIAGVILGPHVAHGSLYYDDWSWSSDVRLKGYWAAVDNSLHTDHRPLLSLYLGLVPVLAGGHAQPELAWSSFAHVAMCLCLYLLLRTLACDRLSSGLISLLVLVYPSADSTWLYVTGSQSSVAIGFYLLGTISALRSFSAHGRRAAVLHAMALALYIASVLLYEIALIAILFSVVMYLTVGPWRLAVRRWAIDVLALIPALVLFTTRAVPVFAGGDLHPVLPLSLQLTHARLIAEESRSVVAASLMPVGGVSWSVAVAAVLIVLMVGLVCARPLRRTGWVRDELHRWLRIAALAVGGTAIGWLILAPSEFYYEPSQIGVGNRINAFAGLWLCVLVVATAKVLAAALCRNLARSRAWSNAMVLVLVTVVAFGYIRRVEADSSHWNAASRAQAAELDAIHQALPRVPAGAEILAFGSPGFAAPGVPIFAASWDLNGAVRLLYGDGAVSGFPVITGSTFNCGSRTLSASGTGFVSGQEEQYGPLFFVDVPRRYAVRIRTRAECIRDMDRFAPGPLQA